MSKLPLDLKDFLIDVTKPYKWQIAVFALIGITWAFINTFLPYTLKLIIDHVVSFHGDKSTLIIATKPYLLIYIALWIALCLNMRLVDWMRLKLFPSIRKETMVRMFSYLNLHSHHYFQNNFAGSLVNKIVDMQQGVIDIFSTLDDTYSQILGLAVGTVTLLFIHPIFSFILFAWAIVFLFVSFIFLKPIENISKAFSESRTTVVGRMVDSISNIINVRLFARHNEENQYVEESVNIAVQHDRDMQAKIIQMRVFWDVSIIILIGLNLYILINMYSKNLVSIGDFTFVMSLSISILWNLWFLASQFVAFSRQVGVCKQAISIITQPHDIVDAEDGKSLALSKGKIEFRNVSFQYQDNTKLFNEKNIVIHPGQKVGLVGFSGSGKSTFVNLILRLFDVQAGEIIIDNQNVNKVTQKSLRAMIGLIPQDITLFHRTLMENIRFGNPNATVEDVINASKAAHCHEFISQLPDGYQSLVGERGIKLSTGQRQRIAIARAILKNAPILILDEATSSLDSITEKYIQDSLTILMSGKTTIVIAHRLSTLSKMDRILVFDNGRVIEDGTHEQLLAQGGHYAKMWQMQAGGFLPEKDSNFD